MDQAISRDKKQKIIEIDQNLPMINKITGLRSTTNTNNSKLFKQKKE